MAWRNLVWDPSTFPRHAFCLWLAILQKLKTRASLEKFGMAVVNACSFCNYMETCSHLFFECAFTGTIWKRVLSGIGIIRNPTIWSSEWRRLMHRARGRNRVAKLIKKASAASIYVVWQERNKCLFANEQREALIRVNFISSFLSA